MVIHGTTPITLKTSSNTYTVIISLLGKTDKSILDATKGKTMLFPFSVSEGAVHLGTGWITSIYNTCKCRDVSIISRNNNTHKSRNPTSCQFIFTMHLPFWARVGQLSWIFRKWEGVVGTGWSWLRIGTGVGHL